MAATENLTLHRYTCSNTGYVEKLGDGVTLTLMQIPAGEFLMGSASDDRNGQDNERPQHRVKVPRFFMGRTSVTQAQWRVVAGYERVDIDLDLAPSGFKGDDLPVERVSWYEATEFCKRLSKELSRRHSPQSQPQYRLPSEAEWEYACRAATTTTYHFGDQIAENLANYDGGLESKVASYPANLWGLYDMHGNVWEWCEDDYHGSYDKAPTDGSAWIADKNTEYKIRRGGSWRYDPRNCRSAFRNDGTPAYRNYDIGFRVCCSAPRILQ
ncbi:formylglycine-generating enzyme family protein [Sphaerothrix gracilis]|uniref:formylglycine-generating enzyme family protein n=1 Tax=Sphaerothrix gracilis TaxID=3151835 RepID=UPI0031FDA558